MTPHQRRKLIHYWRRQIRPILVLILVFTTARSVILDWNDVPSGSMNPTIFTGDRIFVNRLAYGIKFPFTTWQLIKWSEPKRGEIVVFYSPEDGIRLVKRQVGLPGDHVVYKNGRLSITDKSGKVVPISYASYNPSASELPPAPDVTERNGSTRKKYDFLKDFDFFTEDLDGHRHAIALFKDQFIERQLREYHQAPPMRDFDVVLKDDEYFMMGDNRDDSRDCRFIGPAHRDKILGRSSRIMFSLDHDDSYLPRMGRFFKSLP
jgi:signal peptidase I